MAKRNDEVTVILYLDTLEKINHRYKQLPLFFLVVVQGWSSQLVL